MRGGKGGYAQLVDIKAALRAKKRKAGAVRLGKAPEHRLHGGLVTVYARIRALKQHLKGGNMVYMLMGKQYCGYMAEIHPYFGKPLCNILGVVPASAAIAVCSPSIK